MKNKLTRFFLILFVGLYSLQCGGHAQLTVTLIGTTGDETDPCINGEVGCSDVPEDVPLHDLFSLLPGEYAPMSKLGIIDPTGTTLTDDYDGDGIINSKELVSNFWVADYPMIEASVAPPVTMQIEILKDKNGQKNNIVSNIASEDFESRRDKGSEKFHQNEVNEKTVQYTESSENSFDFNMNAGVNMDKETKVEGAPAAGFSVGISSYNATTTDKFVNKPFKNNIDRKATSVKSDASRDIARIYRKEKKSKVDSTSTVESNAGKIRVALSIKNHSINLPVKMSNILCSLLFETSTGELIPVQSFTLKNADYSVFSVEVYGGSEFGPYVIELDNLNTVDIQKAINMGYTPKIFIVDYTMTHVSDSNYKAALSSSYSGNNLKIFEENAKGRTSLIKLIGPGIRELFRVSAFGVDTENSAAPCSLPTAPSTATPGISLEKAIKRIGCSGFNIEFEHYIFDFTGTLLEDDFKIGYTHTLKSIDGIQNNFPCHTYVEGDDINGSLVKACLVRFSDLTPAEQGEFGIWTIFGKGKYFQNLRPVLDSAGDPVYFDGSIPMLEGVDSLVWAGDNYDIVYLSVADVIGRTGEYGTNPLETNASVVFNTRWNQDTYGADPYYPNVNSVYMGQAALGEQLEIQIKISDTWALNPDFGQAVNKATYTLFDTFTYNLQQDNTTLLGIDETFDFQVNFDTGGTREDWYNILRTVSATKTDSNNLSDGVINCGQSWDFLNQVFTVCVEIPTSLTGVGADEIVSIHLRPTPHNAYRESIWPKGYADVNRFEGSLFQKMLIGDSSVEIANASGDILTGTSEAGTTIQIDSTSYTISAVSHTPRVYELNLLTQTTGAYNADVSITVGSFNGTLYKAVAEGDTVIYVLPDSAIDVLISGTGFTNILANISADVYYVSVIQPEVSLHTITLLSTLTADYPKGAVASINAGLTASAIAITEDTNFTTDWNAEASNQPTGLTPNFSTQLYVSAITGCSYGLDSLSLLSPGCQGYSVSPVIANWIGAGGSDNIWSDSSKADTFLTSSLNPMVQVPSSGSSMNIEINLENFQVSGVTNNEQENIQTDSDNGRSLIVWQSLVSGSDTDIRGRVYDTNTGLPLTDEFLINETTTASQLNAVVTVSGDNAFVAWESNATGDYDIKGRILDLTQNPPTVAAHSEITVNTNLTNNQLSPAIDSEGDIVGVGYTQDNGTNRDMKLRLFSFSETITGAGYDASVNINSNSNDDMKMPNVAIKNGKIVFTYAREISAGNWDIWFRVGDVNPFVYTITATSCITASGTQDSPKVEISDDGTKALLLIRGGISPNWNLMGNIISLSATPTCGASFDIDKDNAIIQNHKDVQIVGDKAIVSWRTDETGDFNIKARIVNMDGTMSAIIPVNTVLTGEQSYPRIALNSTQALIAWKSIGTGEMRGQIIDLATEATVDKSDFSLGKLTSSDAYFPGITYNGTFGMIFWQDFNGGSTYNLMGQRFNINTNTILPLTYGMNNFFVSPLIERTYVIKSRLLY
ncbi:MAG: LIC12048 family lipoprotein [Leptospirales bacterium]